MYLVDTNVWLEPLLEQANAEEVRKFIKHTPTQDLAITDFSFHSLGVILGRFSRTDALLTFTEEAFGRGAVRLIRLRTEDTSKVVDAMRSFKLDFDDAYQFVAAEIHDLTLVSFDRDLDQTPRGRVSPAQVTP